MDRVETDVRGDLVAAYPDEAAQLAYLIGHDLRAPVRNIADYAALLEQEMEGRLVGEAGLYLARLRNRVARLQNMIDGVRNFAQVGRDPSPPEPVSLPALVRDIVALVDPQRRASVEVEGTLRELVVERAPLEQALRQLIDNALRHSGRAAPRVRVRVEADGPWYAFAVADDGVGIPPEGRERIWEPFHTLDGRVDDETSPGIGLGIVRKLVAMHGGRARSESAPGEGATIHFTWRRPSEAGARA